MMVMLEDSSIAFGIRTRAFVPRIGVRGRPRTFPASGGNLHPSHFSLKDLGMMPHLTTNNASRFALQKGEDWGLCKCRSMR